MAREQPSEIKPRYLIWVPCLAFLLFSLGAVLVRFAPRVVDGDQWGDSVRALIAVLVLGGSLAWSEIRAVECGPEHYRLVGDDKFLTLMPKVWSGPQREELSTFLEAQIAGRGIPCRTVALAFRVFKNVRVR